jgi:hypothetical protein
MQSHADEDYRREWLKDLAVKAARMKAAGRDPAEAVAVLTMQKTCPPPPPPKPPPPIRVSDQPDPPPPREL